MMYFNKLNLNPDIMWLLTIQGPFADKNKTRDQIRSHLQVHVAAL